MNKSLKISIVAGLITGIISGILYSFLVKEAALLGLWDQGFREYALYSSHGFNILLGIIWGVIIGILYSRIYDLIPSKGISKGLFYGLILFTIVELRHVTFGLSYHWFLNVAGYIFTGSFKWITYGIVLGFLYELLHVKYNIPKEKKKIIQYDWKGGIHPGAIAGIIGGIVSSIITVIMPILGISKIPGTLLEFWLDQAGSHIFWNLIWGIIFGIMFARFYSLLPGKSIIKGIYYGFIVISISSFQNVLYWAFWGMLWPAKWVFPVGFFHAITYGFVLGYIYKK